jgi:signal transduction histidine kinase
MVTKEKITLRNRNTRRTVINKELRPAHQQIQKLQKRIAELSNLSNDLNNLLSSANIPIVMLDDNLRIRRFTKAASRVLNLGPNDVGKRITGIKIKVKVPYLEKLIAKVIKTTATIETTVKDSEECWYSMRIRPYKTLKKKVDGVIIAFIDITVVRESMLKEKAAIKEIADLNKSLERRVEQRTSDLETLNRDLATEVKDRKYAEKSLRILSENLVKAQEAERLRLSRELHDSVNQILTVAKLKVHSVKNSLGKGNDGRVKDISEAKNLLEKAIDEVRKISMNLRPSALDDLGLKAAVHSLIDELKDRTKIKIYFRSQNLTRRLSAETELALYRMIQEALNNVEKHSKATAVNIEIGTNDSELSLKIHDNGKGFKMLGKSNKRVNLKKYGILGMRERTEAVGGKFDIVSSPGSGTDINISIPVMKNE